MTTQTLFPRFQESLHYRNIIFLAFGSIIFNTKSNQTISTCA
jgi:hypothetical protein